MSEIAFNGSLKLVVSNAVTTVSYTHLALVIGHPTPLVASVILIPVILAIAVFLPGNQFLPLASLAGMFYLDVYKRQILSVSVRA